MARLRPMQHLRVPLALRRLVLALAITQLVMSSVAPLHDLRANTDRGDSRVERTHTSAGIPVHDPDTCPVCQLLSAQLIRPDETRVTPSTGSIQRPASVATTMPVARAPPAAHQTRAPPISLA
jgi:hypothetical protein